LPLTDSPSKCLSPMGIRHQFIREIHSLWSSPGQSPHPPRRQLSLSCDPSFNSPESQGGVRSPKNRIWSFLPKGSPSQWSVITPRERWSRRLSPSINSPFSPYYLIRFFRDDVALPPIFSEASTLLRLSLPRRSPGFFPFLQIVVCDFLPPPPLFFFLDSFSNPCSWF